MTSPLTRVAVLSSSVVALLAACSSDPGPPPSTPPLTGVVADTIAVPLGVAPLLGVWDLAESDPSLGECHRASVGFRSDGHYMTKSGDQVVTGRYVASPVVVSGRSGFLVVQRPGAHNGEPNCQGVPADVSVRAAPPDAFIEVVDDEAALFFGVPRGRPAASFVRRTFD